MQNVSVANGKDFHLWVFLRQAGTRDLCNRKGEWIFVLEVTID